MSVAFKLPLVALMVAVTSCGGLWASDGTSPGPTQDHAAKPAPAKKKRKLPFTISKKTTYVTGPVDQDGYIDYVTAVNERLRQGVTPADNANVLLWQVFGPHPEGATMPPSYFHWLGMRRPPEQGAYWIPLTRFLEAHLELAPRMPKSRSLDIEQARSQVQIATRRPWKAKEFPWIAAWLKANARPLSLAIQATRRHGFFNPLVPRGVGKDSMGLLGALLPSIQMCREVGQSLVARAMFEVEEGKARAAWHDLLASHRLARLIGQSGTLVEMLVCLAIDGMTDNADVAFVAHARLNARQVLACLRDLQQLAPLPATADKIDLSERFVLLNATMMMMRWGIDWLERMDNDGKQVADKSLVDRANAFLSQALLNLADWDLALRNANAWYDRLVAALRTPNRVEREKKLAAFDTDFRTLRVHALDGLRDPSALLPYNFCRRYGESIGNVLITLLLPAAQRIQHAAERAEQQQTNAQLAFALAAYRCDHGRYPSMLQDLTPKYRAKIPLDPFNGKPLVYRRSADGYLLYSVGLNGRDEGARGREDEPSGDDLSIRMPPAGR